jgi:hypothetical protein
VQYDGDEKYGCGGQYPFTIAARGMTIGIIARARRWSYCRSRSRQIWNDVAVMGSPVASAARVSRKKRILFPV